MADRGTITELLVASARGDSEAFDRLMPIVYDELRRIAHQYMRRERSGHTLDTTGLVHEAYLKLFDLDRIQYRNRGHFYAIAAQAMRNVLVNYAHRRNAQKRGGRQRPLPLDDVVVMTEQQATQLLDLNDALNRLAELNERQSRVVECRFFAGLTIEETAEALDVSTATVKRDWTAARAWLNRTLGSSRLSPTDDR
jgi:RNA polymerase sigma factor (TIGR02999 family)